MSVFAELGDRDKALAAAAQATPERVPFRHRQASFPWRQVGSPPVLVMSSGYSRWLAAKTIPTRNAEDLVLGQWAVVGQLGAVPHTLVWDNESGWAATVVAART